MSIWPNRTIRIAHLAVYGTMAAFAGLPPDPLVLSASTLFAAGCWLGPVGAAHVPLIASIGGLALGAMVLFAQRSMTNLVLPFGPFLAIAFWLVCLDGV